MIRIRVTAATLVLLTTMTGCATNAEGNTPLKNELTWQEAKAHSQAMELEIAKLIPKSKVVKIEQAKPVPFSAVLRHNITGTEHPW